MPAHQVPQISPAAPRRTLLIDALRALAALIITWHHFALYGPLSDWSQPVTGRLMGWLEHYGRATQIFFVIGGYVLARSLTVKTWNVRSVARYVVRRYTRLAIPYLAAIAMAIAACAFGRGWLPSKVVDPPFTWPQLAAHVFFLQNILGYDNLSAGLWFVCINFQLSLVFIAMLWLRDFADGAGAAVGVQALACPETSSLKAVLQQEVTEDSVGVAGTGAEPQARRSPGAQSKTSAPRRESRGSFLIAVLGWGMAAAALFFYNVDDRWDMWFLYFFGHFYLGVVVYEALSQPRKEYLFWLYVAMVGAALAYSWRWRMVTTLSSGVLLFASGKLGFMDTWPKNRVIAYLGRTSYSLFLVHFPVLVVVATIWTIRERNSPWEAIAGLIVAYLLSLAVADIFYRVVEKSADRLSRQA